jgi:transcriptional regulator
MANNGPYIEPMRGHRIVHPCEKPAMYLPQAFRESDPETLYQLIEACGLALLVTQGTEGLLANHVPLLLTRNGGHAVLHGHLAKANPQWKDLASGASALVVFSGPEAYVSPGFYPSKASDPRVVPTWNYVSVQAQGTPQVFHDPERLYTLVEQLTQRHEAARAEPWAMGDAPGAYLQHMLKAIVGFSIAVDRLEGKRKLSQNRSAADQQGVAGHLAASSRATDQALAAAMAPNTQQCLSGDTPL